MFSFGNVVISTLTHEWPNPGPPTQYRGDQLVALNELQRREHYVVKFTAQEKHLFLPIVRQCLENRPDMRPSSVMLVQELRGIESTLPRGSHVAAPIEQLRQQLSAKEEECRQKDEVIREKDKTLKEKDGVIREKDEDLKGKDGVIREKDEDLKKKDGVIRAKDEDLRNKDEVIREKDEVIRAKDEDLRKKDKVIREKDEEIRHTHTHTHIYSYSYPHSLATQPLHRHSL